MDRTIIDLVVNTPPIERQVLFPVNHTPYIDLRHKNLEILKIYTLITQDFRIQLSKMNSREHRSYILESHELAEKYSDNVLYEFTCVMCSLRVNVKHYAYYMEFDTDSDITKVIGGYNYRKMLRAVYRNTMWENTNHDLEDIVNIEANMQDHYTYFKNKLKCAPYEDALIVVEDAVVE